MIGSAGRAADPAAATPPSSRRASPAASWRASLDDARKATSSRTPTAAPPAATTSASGNATPCTTGSFATAPFGTAPFGITPPRGSPTGRCSPGRQATRALSKSEQAARGLESIATNDLSHPSAKARTTRTTRKLVVAAFVTPLAGAAATVLFIAFRLLLKRDMQVNSGPVCDSYDCRKHAFHVANHLDPRGRPCDDFAGYVCPAWAPVGDASVSVLQDVAYAYSSRLVLRSPEELRVEEARGALAMIHSCVNRSREDSRESLRALRQFLKVEAASTSDPLEKLIDLAVNWNLPILFNVALLPTKEGSGRERLIYIFPSELLEMLFALQKALVTHGLFDQAWENLPRITGVRYKRRKDEILDVLLSVLADLLNATDVSLEDPVFTSVEDLPALNSSEGWLSSFRQAFNVTPAITEVDQVVVTHRSMLNALVQAFDSWKDILTDALQWLVSEYACFLACTELVLALPNLRGAPAAHTTICATEVEATHGLLLDADSAKRLGGKDRENIRRRFDVIKRLVVAKINSTTLLTAEAKLSALEHVGSVGFRFAGAEYGLLGFTEQEQRALTKYYEGSPQFGDVFFRNWMSAREFIRTRDPAVRYQLPAFMRRTLGSTLVYYDPPTHAVVVSAASLAAPLYYRGGTEAMALGGLGFLIAGQLIRSLAHGVDVRSANTSASPLFYQELRRRRHCDSDGWAKLPSWFPGAAALDSLVESLQLGVGGVPIKGLEHLTQRQVFFLTACHVTCRHDGATMYSRQCNGAVKSSVSFAGSFHCTNGSKMNSGAKCILF
ncbi:endothelin-converting enzyme 1-like [Dermacentor variabilis]|uniref:endothelin-converting enzyme 1-like n=1 Tax=Dermacentor variabilis TaxID=34621 RepID=UPI003F5C51FE